MPRAGGAHTRNRYLIWDFDGTLATRQGGWAGALLQTLRRYSTESYSSITAERLLAHLQSGFRWHEPQREHDLLTADSWWASLVPTFEQAYMVSGVTPSEAERLARQVRGVYANLQYWRLLDGARETLDQLASLGWTHLLLSNHVPEMPILLTGLGIDECFAKVFNSAEARHEKPHAEAFRAVLNYIPAEGAYNAVWMIGDNPNADVRGAEAVGIPGILVGKTDEGCARCAAALEDVEGILPSTRSEPS